MTLPVYVFDAYGTLLDVHAAIGRHRDACGADGPRPAVRPADRDVRRCTTTSLTHPRTPYDQE